MVPGSPLALAIGKIKGVLTNHLNSIIHESSDELTLGAAKAEISFLFATALFENSLSGLLCALDLLLRCSLLSFVEEVNIFWKLLSSADLDLSKKNSLIALDILSAVLEKSQKDSNLFPVTSLSDAEILTKWISTFGLFDIGKQSIEFSAEVKDVSNELCSYAAKLLQLNMSRVIPSVDMEKRADILGSLSAPLKDSVDQMVSNPSRDPLHGKKK
jgi:hypothetical protein